jgi:hypothetical protein
MKAVLNAVSSAATESAAAPYKPQKIETFSKARNVERMDYSDFSENGESEPRPAATKKEKGEESILKARAEEYETEPKAKESEPLKEESAAEDKPWHADLKKDEV